MYVCKAGKRDSIKGKGRDNPGSKSLVVNASAQVFKHIHTYIHTYVYTYTYTYIHTFIALKFIQSYILHTLHLEIRSYSYKR